MLMFFLTLMKDECIFFESFLLGCLFWPLWSALFCFFGGVLFGTNLVGVFASFCLCLTLLSSSFIFWEIGVKEQVIYLFLGDCLIIDFETNKDIFFIKQNICFLSDLSQYLENNHFSFQIFWELYFDTLTVIILLVISSISCLVHFYALSYIKKDDHCGRFFGSLSLFSFFILVLVTAGNFLQFFVGWEGVGLCSYLLIGFWYIRLSANRSAIQALIVNKLGDLTLIIAIIFLLLDQNTLTFLTLMENNFYFNDFFFIGSFYCRFIDFLGILLLISATAKSAQLGLHIWLLSAMEGPTPVSALLHAATIVTAGIFLLLRSSFLWADSLIVTNFIIILGACTAFFAAICGIAQYDIKKIIALSTCSQLGYIFYGCGLGVYNVTLFHLTNHAFFKALLFLCAGAVIHALNNEQDLRRIGGLAQVIPITYIAIFIASCSLGGFPFLSGFYSKDVLIEIPFVSSAFFSNFTFFLALGATFLTAFYSYRLLFLVFFAQANIYKKNVLHLFEAEILILWVFRFLLIGSIFSGNLFFQFYLNNGSSFFYGFDNITNFSNNKMQQYEKINVIEFLEIEIKLMPIIFSFCGVVLAVCFYKINFFQKVWVSLNRISFLKNGKTDILVQFSERYRYIQYFLIKKWGFDYFYNQTILMFLYKLSRAFYHLGDQGIFEIFGPQGMFEAFSRRIIFREYSILRLFLTIVFSILSVCFLLIMIFLLMEYCWVDIICDVGGKLEFYETSFSVEQNIPNLLNFSEKEINQYLSVRNELSETWNKSRAALLNGIYTHKRCANVVSSNILVLDDLFLQANIIQRSKLFHTKAIWMKKYLSPRLDDYLDHYLRYTNWEKLYLLFLPYNFFILRLKEGEIYILRELINQVEYRLCFVFGQMAWLAFWFEYLTGFQGIYSSLNTKLFECKNLLLAIAAFEKLFLTALPRKGEEDEGNLEVAFSKDFVESIVFLREIICLIYGETEIIIIPFIPQMVEIFTKYFTCALEYDLKSSIVVLPKVEKKLWRNSVEKSNLQINFLEITNDIFIKVMLKLNPFFRNGFIKDNDGFLWNTRARVQFLQFYLGFYGFPSLLEFFRNNSGWISWVSGFFSAERIVLSLQFFYNNRLFSQNLIFDFLYLRSFTEFWDMLFSTKSGQQYLYLRTNLLKDLYALLFDYYYIPAKKLQIVPLENDYIKKVAFTKKIKKLSTMELIDSLMKDSNDKTLIEIKAYFIKNSNDSPKKMPEQIRCYFSKHIGKFSEKPYTTRVLSPFGWFAFFHDPLKATLYTEYQKIVFVFQKIFRFCYFFFKPCVCIVLTYYWGLFNLFILWWLVPACNFLFIVFFISVAYGVFIVIIIDILRVVNKKFGQNKKQKNT